MSTNEQAQPHWIIHGGKVWFWSPEVWHQAPPVWHPDPQWSGPQQSAPTPPPPPSPPSPSPPPTPASPTPPPLPPQHQHQHQHQHQQQSQQPQQQQQQQQPVAAGSRPLPIFAGPAPGEVFYRNDRVFSCLYCSWTGPQRAGMSAHVTKRHHVANPVEGTDWEDLGMVKPRYR